MPARTRCAVRAPRRRARGQHGRTGHRAGRRAAPVVSLALVGALLAACSPGGDTTPTAAGQPHVEVFTWWASGSEKLALDALSSTFAEQHPGIRFDDAGVAGGAGSAAKDVLDSRMAAGDPPDTFQVHGGAELADHVAAHDLRPLDDVAADLGLAAVVPQTVLAATQVDGVTYAIPSNVHRANVVWANTSVLQAAGLAPTTAFASLDEWFVALEAVEETGATPLALGADWTQVHLLEAVLLAQLGAEGYRGLWDGSTDPMSAEVTAALGTFSRLVGYSDEDRASLDWEDMTFRVAEGEAAFMIMGDWALPAFRAADIPIGNDVLWAPAPGTSGSFGLVVDAFAIPGPATNVEEAVSWVSTIGSAEAQTALSSVKGSIPARTDVSVQALHPYQLHSTAALERDELVPSLAHGTAVDGATLQEITQAVGSFTEGRTSVAQLQRALASALGED
ncbi:ABC transporter substrate-binding protein [Actinotalea sp. C106]|uniref:ABC transporter substrate-binding protein n=1 Tax=Actinotalea sp. C106 TaxID=2908644 RepID=UPI002027FC41|nr:ABC transporter substrate-binding protein [Actinotalea sp. C106]